MDLNEIRLFVQVARAGHFAVAARRLHMPTNTLSRRIRQLETALKTRLLHRSTRKLALTPSGQAFFDRCAPAVDDLLAAAQQLADGSGVPQGPIRVAAPAGFLELLRLDWIAEFIAGHPRVAVDFVLDDARNDLIADGIDVAFRAGATPGASYAVLRTLVAQPFRLYASPRYVAARGAPRRVADLAVHDCLIASPRAGRATWRLQGPAGHEEVAVAGRFGANNVHVLLQAAIAGLGVALLPAILALGDVDAGRLVALLPAHWRDGADLQVVVPSRHQVPPGVTAFIDFAEAKLRATLTPTR